MCKSCGKNNQSEFSSEVCIHFAGVQNLSKPAVFVFPKLLICLDCGFTEFPIAETELRLVAQTDSPMGAQTAFVAVRPHAAQRS